jgi:hypothetical protein
MQPYRRKASAPAKKKVEAVPAKQSTDAIGTRPIY